MLLLLGETLLSPGVAVGADLPQKRHVGLLVRKSAAAAEQQRLLHRSLEAMMTLLGITVLMALARIDRLRLHSVVRHHRLIATREEVRTRSLHCQTHAITAMLGRYAAQRPDGVLKTFTEALETLREAKRHVFPIGMRQHEVVHQMRERLAVDGHTQGAQVSEVRGAQPTRQVLLREE